MALTRMQIQSKINITIRNKDNKKNELAKYRESLEYANKILNNLKNSDNQLNTANDNLKKYFSINGKTADNGKVVAAVNNINKIIKQLNNTIIPNIRLKINLLTDEIRRYDDQIRNLRREYEAAIE